MTTDPVQLLIDAGAIPTSPFAPAQPLRRRGARRCYRARPGRSAACPMCCGASSRSGATSRSLLEHIVQSGDRPDLLAARTFGDAELYWRIADANAVTDPFELTDTLGRARRDSRCRPGV